MKTFKAFLLVLAAVWLAACSSGPSDREVQAIMQSQMDQINALSHQFGIPAADYFDSRTTVLNRVEQEGGRWLVEVEHALVAKKSLTEAFPDPIARGVALFTLGNFQRGQEMLITRSTMILQKGERGWIVVRQL